MFLLTIFSKIGTKVCEALHLLIAPHFCALCSLLLENTILLCSSCLSYLQPVASKRVFLTKKQFFTVHALSLYKDEFKPILHAKYYQNEALFYELGELIWKRSAISSVSFDIIVPIPLHWTRYAWRGFNQAETMASAISGLSKKPVIHLLKRSKKTELQSLLSKKERQDNMHNAFEIALSVCEFELYKKSRILLVDDLYTTGATVQEAVTLLSKQKCFVTDLVVAFRGL